MNDIVELKYKYDPFADALSIEQKSSFDYEESIELESNIFVDLDTDEKPVGIEILDASKVFNVNKLSLKNIKCIYMKIEVSQEIISLNFHLGIEIHNKSLIKQVDSNVVNDFNIPTMTTELATA